MKKDLKALELTKEGEEAGRAKNFRKALESFEKALKLAPQNIRAWWSASHSNTLLGNHKLALAQMEKAERLARDKGDYKLADALVDALSYKHQAISDNEGAMFDLDGNYIPHPEDEEDEEYN